MRADELCESRNQNQLQEAQLAELAMLRRILEAKGVNYGWVLDDYRNDLGLTVFVLGGMVKN